MSYRDAGRERLLFLADVVMLEARYLAQTDGRLFARPLVVEDIDRLPLDADLSERVDAFVARFGRLQDTLAGAFLPRLLESLLEPQGSVLDNLNRAERRGWNLVNAAALMAAGWDGAPKKNAPGFPANGQWNVRWENLRAAP